MKKIISLFTALVVMASAFVFVVPAKASDGGPNQKDTLLSTVAGLEKSEYDGYYIDSEENYYSIVNKGDEELLVPVEQIQIDFDNEDLIADLLDMDLGSEFKESLLRDYYNYKSLPDDEKYSAVVFIEDNEISGVDEEAYGTNGYIYNSDGTYRSIEYIVYNYSTGWEYLKRGSGTRNAITNVAEVCATIFASGSSHAATAVNYFLTGVTIVNAFRSFYNLGADYVIPTNAQDYFQARLVFDKYTRYVHHKVTGSSWETCLVLNKAVMKKIGQETYFASTGEAPYTCERSVNISYVSDHYNNYWTYATNFDGDSTYFEYLKFTCCGFTWLMRN